MMLLVGLGNPGTRYEKTRHNVGFMALDRIVERHGFAPPRSRFQGEACEGTLGNEKCLALKPMTFMNLSGQAVGEAMRFYKLAPADIVVIYDEIDLAPGKMRVKRGGGTAGHNGLRNIGAHIGDEFRRVRIGIGHPGVKDVVQHYVLSNFAKADDEWLEPLLDAIAAEAAWLASNDDNRFSTAVALRLAPPKKDKTKDAAASDEEQS